jgi:hypothetical protein
MWEVKCEDHSSRLAPGISKRSRHRCLIPVNAAMQEAESGSSSKTSLGKSMRPYLKNKLKQKGLGAWSSGRAPA